MAEISAAAVKALRDKTQLPLMECKRALAESGGDEEQAIRLLRESGKKTMAARSDRSTGAGVLAIHTSFDPGVGAMVELQCESAPVAGHEEFVRLARDLAEQLATGAGADAPDALWSQPSPSQSGKTLAEQRDDLSNRIRELFRLQRLVRIDGSCGGYVHFTGTNGVLVEVQGGTPDLAKDVAMHIAAMRPAAVHKEDIDPAEVQKEREILFKQAESEGKPSNIVEKMVEGRLRNFYAERVLAEQPFIRDEKTTVGKYAAQGGMKLVRFVHWELGG